MGWPTPCASCRVSASCENALVPSSGGRWYPRSFVLTDIVGSVALWERDAEAMSTAVACHDAIVGREVAAAGGELVTSLRNADSRGLPTAGKSVDRHLAVFRRPAGGK